MRVSIPQAITLLQAGEVVAIPTETVYGLAARLHDKKAVGCLFALKKRPAHNPLIAHIASPEECSLYCPELPAGFDRLASAFWPGPLTMVLPVQESKIPSAARAGLSTCAFRMPVHPMALELLQSVSPLVAPSANLSGSPSATRPEHVENDFGSDFPVVDGGRCLHGVESTIVVPMGAIWHVARLGAISQEALAAQLGYLPELAARSETRPISPGQLLAHYAPKARLVLSKTSYKQCPKRLPHVVGFQDREYAGAEKVFHLGSSHEADTACHRLYDLLRRLDQAQVEEAWVDIDFPAKGLWLTLHERISRAARR